MACNQENKTDIVLIKGPTGAGKTRMLQERYQTLLQESVRSDRILVLVRSRRQSILWRDNIHFRRACNMRIQSFFGFIQNEIKKYWPLISSEIEGFKSGMSEPVFLTSEVSQFLLTKYIEDFREQGKLMDITASSQRIAIEGLSNLSRAAAAGIKPDSIGFLLSSCQTVTAVRERVFQEFQEVLSFYVNSCRQNGYIDYFTAVDIYNNCMLKKESYLERHKQETRHIIADGMEDAIPCEIDFLRLVLDDLESGHFSFSTDDTFSRRQGACPEYVQSVLVPKCTKVIELQGSFTCSKPLFDFSDSLCRYLAGKAETVRQTDEDYSQSGVMQAPDCAMEVIQTELRSEMIKSVCQRIHQLLNDGFKPEDIVVLCPVVDSVLEYCLKSFFRNERTAVVNISRTGRYMDGSFSRALITLACLCHPQWEMNPPEHDIANLVGMVLGLDPVRSSLIAKEVVSLKPFALPVIESLEFRDRIGFKNSDRYYFLKRWIEEYREHTPVPIDSFFQNAFITILLNLPKVEEHVNSCRLLIESSTAFLKTLDSTLDDDSGRAFVRMIKQGVKPAETIQDLEQKIYSHDLIISTPQAYLASSMDRKVQVWIDIWSLLWYRSDVEELSNPYIFLPNWNAGSKWTDELNEKYRLQKCSVLVKRLLRRCTGVVIAAGSLYNQDGYENDGLLGEVLDEAGIRENTLMINRRKEDETQA